MTDPLGELAWWAPAGLCRTNEYPPGFFASPDVPADAEDAAIAVCRQCPSRWPCLAWAIQQEDRQLLHPEHPDGTDPARYDIYGGTRPAQRETLSLDMSEAYQVHVEAGNPPNSFVPETWLAEAVTMSGQDY